MQKKEHITEVECGVRVDFLHFYSENSGVADIIMVDLHHTVARPLFIVISCVCAAIENQMWLRR